MSTSTLNPQFETVGLQFVQHYYQMFNANRVGLVALYGPESMLTFENNKFLGPESIMGKLNALPAKLAHKIVTCDCQPTPNNGIIVFVAGDLSIENDEPVKFAEAFHLVPSPAGSYIIFNDLFRFCIG